MKDFFLKIKNIKVKEVSRFPNMYSSKNTTNYMSALIILGLINYNHNYKQKDHQ